jgi:crotonobetaine/carnitine-CoA ligase
VEEFATRVRRCAAALKERGVAAGDRVGLMSRNSAHQMAWQYGVHLAGAVEVPINADLRGPMLAHVLRDSAPTLVLVQEPFQEVVGASGVDVHVARIDDEGVLAAGAPLPGDLAMPGPAELATILYTSGTTGLSKGVMLSHGYFSNLGSVFVNVLELDEDDVAYFVLPFFHVDGHITASACLQSGSVLSFIDRFSVRRFWEDVRRFGATWSILVGAMQAAVMAGSSPPPRDTVRMSRMLAAPIPAESYDYFEERLGIQLLAVYGQTEADGPLCETPTLRRRGSVGWPCTGFDVAILDTDGCETEPGTPGEIAYRPQYPNMVTLGYWNKPEVTVAAWRDLWFHSGDVGTMDEDGFVYYKGRLTDSLRRRGENVSAYELELTIRGADGVADCAAVPVIDELGGEDEIKVFVALEPGAVFDAVTFFRYCEENLPRFAVPRFAETVDPDAFVRAAGSGAIQKHRLPASNGPHTIDRTALNSSAGARNTGA